MKVSDVMTAQVVTATPDATIEKIASIMAEIDTGAVPIVEGGKTVGLVTDRDIVVRVVAKGIDLKSPASDIMSEDVLTCLEEDTVADAASKMGDAQVRRLVVVNESGALVGIVSLGDIALDFGAKKVGEALEEISEPAS